MAIAQKMPNYIYIDLSIYRYIYIDLSIYLSIDLNYLFKI